MASLRHSNHLRRLFFFWLVAIGALGLSSSPSRDCTAWFKANGGVAEAVRAAPVDGAGWGLITTRPVSKGEDLTVTPHDLCFASEPAGDDYPKDMSPAGIVATKILEAKKRIGATTGRTPTTGIIPDMTPYLESLPLERFLPVLWPDEEATELLFGTQTLASREEVLRDWSEDHALTTPDFCDWDDWRDANAVVMSRGYNVETLGYAVVPFLDYVNHDDRPTAKVVDDGRAVKLVALRDLPADTQIFATYSKNEPLDGLKMLQAFGWLPPEVATCNVDFVEALRVDDPMAAPKFELLIATGGRTVFTVDDRKSQQFNDACLDFCLEEAALPALRLAALRDEDEFKALLRNVADSKWFNNEDIGNDPLAVKVGVDLINRRLARIARGGNRRKDAVAKCQDKKIAYLAQATAAGEIKALGTLREALVVYGEKKFEE